MTNWSNLSNTFLWQEHIKATLNVFQEDNIVLLIIFVMLQILLLFLAFLIYVSFDNYLPTTPLPTLAPENYLFSFLFAH